MSVDLRGLPADVLDRVTAAVRPAGGVFGLVHGSRAGGTATGRSDLVVAVWFADPRTRPWGLELPARVDLLSLNRLPLALAGRIAVHSVLLFDDDPPRRVRWQADTRLRWFDEAWRRETATRDFLEARARG